MTSTINSSGKMNMTAIKRSELHNAWPESETVVVTCDYGSHQLFLPRQVALDQRDR